MYDGLGTIFDSVDKYIEIRLRDIVASSTREVPLNVPDDRWEPINPHANIPMSPWYYKYALKKYEVLDWSKNNKVWARDKHTNTVRYLGPFDFEVYKRS